jgi:hypothetical protein
MPGKITVKLDIATPTFASLEALRSSGSKKTPRSTFYRSIIESTSSLAVDGHGRPEDGRRVTIYLDGDTHKAAKRRAGELGVTLLAYIRGCLAHASKD